MKPTITNTEKLLPRSMNIYALPGHKVKATKETINYGRDSENRVGIEVDKVYTVKETTVSGWSTVVRLEEVEGDFNSVIFVDVVTQSKDEDAKHPHYRFYH